MALVTRKIKNTGDPLMDPSGNILSGVKINFILVNIDSRPTDAWDAVTNERIAPINVSVTTDISGEFTVNLWPNDRGEIVTKYLCSVDSMGIRPFLATVSSGLLTDISWIEFMSNGQQLDPVEMQTVIDILTQSQAAADTATAQAVIATDKAILTASDALATAADRVQTGLDRTATASDKNATTSDVILTHADVVLTHADALATNADRTQTGLDRVSASGSATTATTQAGIATSEAAIATAAATSVSSVMIPTVFNASATVAKGYRYIVASKTSALTMTFPATASVGDTFEVEDGDGALAVNNLTVIPNGLHIDGSRLTVVYSTPNVLMRFTYSGPIYGWKMHVISSGIPTTDANDFAKTLDMPLLGDLLFKRSIGAASGTFSRATAQTYVDGSGVLRSVPSGSPAYDGLRGITNLLTYTEDFSNAAWTKSGTATVTGTNILNFPALNDNVVRSFNGVFPVGSAVVLSATLSGSGTVSLLSFGTSSIANRVTLTPTPTRYRLAVTTDNANMSFYIARRTATSDTATTVTCDNIQLELAVIPSEYSPNLAATINTIFKDYANPNTVDGNGVVTDSGVRTPLTSLGIKLEPVSTNKCTCYSVPQVSDAVGVKLTGAGTFNGFTSSGVATAVFSVVDDTTALTSAGYNSIVNSGKAYKLDNSAGASLVQLRVGGTTANINKHSISIVARKLSGAGVSSIRQGYGSSPSLITSATYSRLASNGFTPGGVDDCMDIQIGIGDVIIFIIPQLEELSYATSPILTAGAAATRNATVLTGPLTANLPSGTKHISLYFSTAGYLAGTKQYLWSSRTDANNEVSIWHNGVIVALEKKVAGVSEYVTYDLTPVVGTSYLVDAYIYADNTMGLAINGTLQSGTLGSELVTNGTFDTTTGLTPTNCTVVSIAGGFSGNCLEMTRTASTAQIASGNISPAIVTTKPFEISMYIKSGTSGNEACSVYCNASLAVAGTTSAAWTKIKATAIPDAAAGTINIQKSTATAGTMLFDNVSVKAVLNNSTTLAPVFASTFEVGSSASLNQLNGNLNSLKIYSR